MRRRTTKQVKERRIKILAAYKIACGCARCGYNERSCALHFAHKDQMSKSLQCVGKTGTNKAGMGMNRLTGIIYLDPVKNRKAIKALFEEIRKCRVLCANCHAIETHDRGEHKNNYVIARARLGIPEPRPDTQEDMFHAREEQKMG